MGVDKKILEQYVDACEMIRETEQDIKRLQRKRQTIVTGSVKGSMNDFPYAETHFKIEGTSFTYTDDAQLRIEEKLLEERKAQSEEIKLQVGILQLLRFHFHQFILIGKHMEHQETQNHQIQQQLRMEIA